MKQKKEIMNKYLINGNRIKYLFIFKVSFFLAMIDVMIYNRKKRRKMEKNPKSEKPK